MNGAKPHISERLAVFAFSLAIATGLIPACLAIPFEPQTPEAAGASRPSKHIGAIKAISGNVITLTPDSGPQIDISVEPTTRIVRIAPGEKTLKNATAVQLQDLQVCDRILVAGKASDDAKAITPHRSSS